MSRTDVSRPKSDVSDQSVRRARTACWHWPAPGSSRPSSFVLHVVEDEFEPCSRFISEYVLGDWGWLMNLAFIALGGAFLAVAHGLRRTLSPGRRVTASVRLMYIAGITIVLQRVLQLRLAR